MMWPKIGLSVERSLAAPRTLSEGKPDPRETALVV